MSSKKATLALAIFKRDAEAKGYDIARRGVFISPSNSVSPILLVLDRFSRLPPAVEDGLLDPLGGRDDMDAWDRQKASNVVKRHGCYTQWARLLRVCFFHGHYDSYW